MKKAIICVALLLVIVGLPAYWVTRAQTVGDDLAVALVNHGVDSATAPVAAAAIEIAVANQNALLARINTDEASIVSLQNAMQQLSAKTAAPLLPQEALLSNCAASAGSTWNSSEGPTVGSYAAGTTFDCPIGKISTTGRYNVIFRYATPNSGGVVQLESPPGTAVGAINPLPTGGWTTFATSAPVTVSLAAGTTSLRLVCEAQCTNARWID